MDIFAEARARINESTIENYFPGGRWDNPDSYVVCSPLRADRTPGSFHIASDGRFYDFATNESGDFITLLSRAHNITLKAAAEEIAGKKMAPMKTKKTTNTKKAEAVFPIPEEKNILLNEKLKNQYTIEKHGIPKCGWSYRDAKGGWLFSVVRFEKDNGKSVLPFYFGKDDKWHEGQCFTDNRPLFNLDKLTANPDSPVLIVEGEKCASVSVPGYVVTTWSSGAASFKKTDFSPLAGRDVTIWPDADEPGRAAAEGIKKILPDAVVLEINDQNEGWDIADALHDGINLLEFIEAHRRGEEYKDSSYFKSLGSDDEGHHFLNNTMRRQLIIPIGKFTTSMVQELAPASYWAQLGYISDSGKINLQAAQDYLVGESYKAGYFKPDELYGSGVWKDNGDFVVNTGREIITRQGQTKSYAEFTESKKTYLASEVTMSGMMGPEATAEQGKKLFKLFEYQQFQSNADVLAAFGWCMLAPFGGILDWRPHIWLSGKRGTGKSWVLDNLIKSLCGDYAYCGSGKDTEAGIRRSLKTDARPVILDEMESLQKRDDGKITGILSLARNASCNGSGDITITGINGKPIHYKIRSCFCFASIRTPDKDAAVDSRIVKVELRNCTAEEMSMKREKSASLLRELIRGKADEYRRRIFRKLPEIISDIELLRNSELLDKLGDTRVVDQWAPLFAFWNAAVNDMTIRDFLKLNSHDSEFDPINKINSLLSVIQGDEEEKVDDEDSVIEYIIQGTVRTDGNLTRTVAECLESVRKDEDTNGDIQRLLERNGISISKRPNFPLSIVIDSKSDAIAGFLFDTPYSSGYDAMLKRNSLCLTPGKRVQVRQAGRRIRGRAFDFDKFINRYLMTEA